MSRFNFLYLLRMKQFLVTLPRNLIGCFMGRRIVWHVIAIFLTFILVMSGFDWHCYLATRNPALRLWMWPAVGIGGLLPLALPLILLAHRHHCQKRQKPFWPVGPSVRLNFSAH